MISSFGQTSRLIARIIACGYDSETSLSTLLSHIGLYDSTDNDIDNIISLLSNKYSNIRTILTIIGTNRAITICDELHAPSVGCDIMTKTINTVMSNDILNFTLTCKGLVRAYSRGYKLVTTESHTVAHNSEQALYHAALNDAYITHLKIYKVDRGANHKSLCTYDIAIQNMLRDVRSLSLCNVLTNIYQVCADSKGYDDTDDISDDDICYQPIIPHYDELKIFTNLKKIRALNNVNLPDYAIPNFDSLVEVCIPCADEYINHHITTHTNKDIALSPCTRIRVLNVSGNPIITTCDPFAASLRILYAERHCGISDKSLERCKRIKLLSASNNPHITTCIPFATSLVKLSAGGECGVGDTGIHLCIRLKYLRATNNANITVYDSFKKYSQNTIRKSYTCSEQ